MTYSGSPVSYGGFDSYSSSLPYDNPYTAQGSDNLNSNPATVLNYSDGALPTYLTRDIGGTDAVLPVHDTSNYPTPPFVISLEAGSLQQEIVLVQALTPTSFTNCIRNFDGNGAFSHQVFANINHSLTAEDYNIMNHHVFDDTTDWHSQYLDQFRHNNTALHQLGVSIPYSAPTVSNPGDSSSEGVSSDAVPSDHVHGRETLQEILYNSLPVGMAVMINAFRTDTFYWLQDATSGSPAPNPFVGWTNSPPYLSPGDFTPLYPGNALIENHVWNYSIIVDPRVGTIHR